MYLYPRLPSKIAAGFIKRYRKGDLQTLRSSSELKHDAMFYTPVGGSRVPLKHLEKLRQKIFLIAKNINWPDPLVSTADKNRIDNLLSVILHQHMDIIPADASRDDVWTFMSCVVVPDIVRWRFPGKEEGTSSSRYMGGVRNTLQRLWWRGYVFRDEDKDKPYWLLGELGEDELVQIMERPVLSGNRLLAKRIAIELLDQKNHCDGLSRMELLREVTKRLVRKSSIISLDSIAENELFHVVSSTYNEVAG